MKLAVALLSAMVALATVQSIPIPSFGKGPLYDDIRYFVDKVPMDDIFHVATKYALHDEEFREMLSYARTEDFKQLLKEVEEINEFRVFVNYMEENGVYVKQLLNRLNKVVGIPALPELLRETITGGLKGFFNDVKQYIDYDTFIHGYVYKMRTSAAFRDFVGQLKSDNHQRFVDTLYANERFLKYRSMLTAKGVDIALVEDIVYTVLGIQFPELDHHVALFANELSKDIRDFIALLDTEKMVKIFLSYSEDKQVQEALTYFYSEEFHKLVRKVEALREYQNLVIFLHDAGLDVYSYIEKLHKFLGMEDYNPPTMVFSSIDTFARTGGLKRMIDEEIDTIPINKFRALYNEKMQTSPAFKNFMMKLRSNEFHQIVNAVYNDSYFRELRQKALSLGLDLQRVRNVFERIGIHLPIPQH